MAKSREKLYKTPVIAGRYKGRMIKIPTTKITRSSKAILRESIFNTIGSDIVDRAFVEVFAGSGSVAIEAVSRGASEAWCIERDRAVYEILRTNVQNITDGQIHTAQGDSFELFDEVHRELKVADRKAFFYFDPPFSIRKGMEDVYKKVFELIESIDESTALMVIVEYMSRMKVPERVGRFKLKKSRKFGKSSLAYYIPIPIVISTEGC
jgi:16S rRNA (guanine(966)-N(2))-methyltransferase RsmD